MGVSIVVVSEGVKKTMVETKEEIGICCPFCGRVQKITRWHLVNLDNEPLAKLRAMKGTLFTVPCEACGEPMQFVYPCIFLGETYRALLYLCSERTEPDLQTLSALPPEQGYKLRLVHTPEEVAEKLQIYDCGFEDTVIELVKVFYFMQFHQNFPTETVEKVLFQQNPKPCIRMMCQSGKSYEMPLDPSYYKKIQTQYQERIWKRTGQDMQRIDAAWASGVLEL